MARLLLLALLPVLSLATPVNTTSSAIAPNCNHDNCLREFIGSTSAASSFCHSFTITPPASTSIVTATATVSSTLTDTIAPAKRAVPARATPAKSVEDLAKRDLSINPSPAPAKRAEILDKRAQAPNPGPEKRTVKPAFPSMCTSGATTRTASACSCLGMPLTTAPVPTVSVTIYPTTVTVAVCNDAQYGNGIAYGSGGVDSNPEKLVQSFDTSFPGVTDPRECCAKCFTTTGCVNYFTYFLGYCQLDTFTAPAGTPPDAGASAVCPNGDLGTFLQFPTSDPINGLGPCGSFSFD